MKRRFWMLLAFGLAATPPALLASTISAPPGDSVAFSGMRGPGGTRFSLSGLALDADTGVIGMMPSLRSDVDTAVREEMVSTAAGQRRVFSPRSSTIRLLDRKPLRSSESGASRVSPTAFGYLVPPPDDGTAASNASSTASGSATDFSFIDPGGKNPFGSLPSGAMCASNNCSPDWLDTDRNAAPYTLTEGLGIRDDAVAYMLGYAPTAAPEPVTTYFLSGALILLAVARSHRRRA